MEKELAHQAFAQSQAYAAQELTLARDSKEEKIRLLREEATFIAGLHGADSAQAISANTRVLQAEQELADLRRTNKQTEIERNAAHNSQLVDDSVAYAKQEVEMGSKKQIDLIAIERTAAEQKRDIQIQLSRDTAELFKGDAAAARAARDEEGKAWDLYYSKMRSLDMAQVKDIKKKWEGIFSPITSAFSTSIQAIIQGTTTIKEAFRNMGASIILSFVDAGIKMAANWAINQLTMTAATEAGVAARTAAEQAGSSQSILMWALTASKNILNSAWEAMAGAFKAMVGIPVVGPAIAPAAAGGAFAAVAAMAGSVSAAGGYDIPSGVNPLVQAHQREMILPQKQADTIRNLAKGGGGGAVHLNVTAVDAASVRRLFMDHGPALSDAIRRQARNFTPTVAR